MHHNDITSAIIETSIDIHRRLGPGLLESVYRKILAYELQKRGFDIQMEQPIPVVWDGMRLELGFRADVSRLHPRVLGQSLFCEVTSNSSDASASVIDRVTSLTVQRVGW